MDSAGLLETAVPVLVLCKVEEVLRACSSKKWICWTLELTVWTYKTTVSFYKYNALQTFHVLLKPD